MKRLILTRHAKSSWDDPLTPDHDRPLNERGKAAAADLGVWLCSRGYVPDEVLCSDALRTRKTWSGIAPALPGTPVLELKPSLYHAGPDVMLAVLKHAKGDTVMMIGHNPGISEFAARLVARAPSHAEFARYPTGATLVCDFAVEAMPRCWIAKMISISTTPITKVELKCSVPRPGTVMPKASQTRKAGVSAVTASAVATAVIASARRPPRSLPQARGRAFPARQS